MRDWRGCEGLFHRGELPVEELLELTEPHFHFEAWPAPELSIFTALPLERDKPDRYYRSQVPGPLFQLLVGITP